MGIIKEFREFAIKGNMIDLAVGVVIGGAFGKIVNALVENILMPPLNLLTRKYGVDFNQMKFSRVFDLPVLNKDGTKKLDAAGNVVMEAQEVVFLKYGAFLQSIVDFTIIAFSIFLVVKIINEAKKRFEKEKEATPAAATAEDILLLREIRDELKSR